MDIENNLLSVEQVFNYYNKEFDKKQIVSELRNHEDYPSFLSYFDVFESHGINVYPLKISEIQIERLEFPILSMLFDKNHGNILSFIKKGNNSYKIYIKNEEKKVDINEIKKNWLGFVFCLSDIINENLKVNDYENFISFNHRGLSASIIGMRNQLINNAFNYNIYIDIIGNDNKITIEENTDIRDIKIKIRGNNNKLTIGKNCRVSGNFLLEHGDCSITIQQDTTIEYAEISAAEEKTSIAIGSNVMISSGVIISTTDSHSIIDKNSKKRINKPQNVLLKNNVWFARNVMILKGVVIENDCVVGAGSVVTKNLKSNSIYAGNPAKLIKEGVEWNRELLPFD
jgi:acetyltransferase-like isoleucine patch superfamily enzyme